MVKRDAARRDAAKHEAQGVTQTAGSSPGSFADGFAGTFAILGAGAWGTALAAMLASAGRSTVLWSRDPAQAADIAARRENARYLPGVPLPATLRATGDLCACADAGVVLLVIPTQSLRAALAPMHDVLRDEATLVLCAKGIERGTDRFPSEIVSEVCPGRPVAVLSGPSFAADVARGLPTAVTLACADERRATALCDAIGTRNFRPYASGDVRGAEIGGAAKNVLAIACGIADGRGLGASARAALTTRGFAELSRFGIALGARSETLMGLSGLGDLLLSCGSPQSRNFALGVAIGQGADPAQAIRARLAEGAWTAPALVKMARERGVAMPIAEAVDAVLDRRIDVAGAIEGLLARPYRRE